MPIVVTSGEKQVRRGPGWSEVLLADPTTVGEPIAMSARRYTFESGVRSELIDFGSDESFLYVVRGEGNAQVGDELFALQEESVLWLNPGDPPMELEAGAAGLDVLIARAPGS
jgi:quercetin dioxygenase-like cupin family protein